MSSIMKKIQKLTNYKETNFEKCKRYLKYFLFALFSLVNAVSAATLGSNNSFYSKNWVIITMICLFFSMLMMYWPSKINTKEKIVAALLKKNKESEVDKKKSNNSVLTIITVLTCIALALIGIFVLHLPLLYVELAIVSLFFLTKTIIDIYAPTVREQILAELDEIELTMSVNKDKENEIESNKNDKNGAGFQRIRKTARVFGAFNAVFANGLLTIAGFSGSINPILENLFGANNVFTPGLEGIPSWQIAIYSLLFFVGVYTSYAITKKSIEDVFYSVSKKIYACYNKKQTFQKSRYAYVAYSVIIGGGLTYLVCNNLYKEMLNQWHWSSNVCLAIIIIVAFYTFIAASCLLGRSVFKGFGKVIAIFNENKREVVLTMLAIIPVVVLINFPAKLEVLVPCAILAGLLAVGLMFSLYKKPKNMIISIGFIISAFSAGSYMLTLVPGSNIALQVLFGVLAIASVPAWLALFVNSNWMTQASDKNTKDSDAGKFLSTPLLSNNLTLTDWNQIAIGAPDRERYLSTPTQVL